MNGTVRWRERPAAKGGSYWEAQVYLGQDGRGKARFKTKTIRTPKNKAGRKLADAALRKLVTEVEDGTITCPTGQDLPEGCTLDEFVGRYLKREPQHRGWASSTALVYDENLNRYLCNFVFKGKRLGSLPMRSITDRHIDTLYSSMLDRKLGLATVNKLHAVCRAAFNRAMRSPYRAIDRNPFLQVEVTPAKNPDIVIPPTGDIKRLIAGTQPDFAVWLMLASSFGARRGTLCALRFSNLDLDQGYIEFAHAVGDGGRKHGGLQVKGLKADNPYIATLAPHEVTALTALRDRRVQQVADLGREWTEDEFVFTPDGTNMWRPSSVSHRFAKLASKLEIEITLHQLKHFAVSTMLANGIDVSKVAIRTGTSERTIINKYRRFIRGQDTAAAELMSDIFGDDNIILLAAGADRPRLAG